MPELEEPTVHPAESSWASMDPKDPPKALDWAIAEARSISRFSRARDRLAVSHGIGLRVRQDARRGTTAGTTDR